jgi:predicted dehydrogenase
MAARIDDRYELVAGALSSDPARAAASAAELHIAAERSYADYREMAKAEAARNERDQSGIDVVAIVTPNHLHGRIATAFLDAGIDVICDKPVTTTLAEALTLVQLVRRTGRLFALTHNYSGYPMVRQAREMIAAGALGEIRVVQVEYAQDWLSTDLEASGQKQAAWRVDPAQAGAGGSLGDIGTHAEQLARYVTGLELAAVSADITSFVPGRKLDDNAHVLLRYTNGARGMLWCSQVAPGNENALRLRVFGSQAGLEFRQEHPNQLTFTALGQAPQTISRGGSGSGAAAAFATRTPAGHPEGYLEGFAQLYRDVAEQITARWQGRAADPLACSVPTVEDGALGMKFIEAVVESSRADGRWADARLKL